MWGGGHSIIVQEILKDSVLDMTTDAMKTKCFTRLCSKQEANLDGLSPETGRCRNADGSRAAKERWGQGGTPQMCQLLPEHVCQAHSRQTRPNTNRNPPVIIKR